MKHFSDLGLSAPLLDALNQMGFQQATPIQQAAIPILLQGKDLLAAAQTGTGKTAAFCLPILERFMPFANSSLSPAKHPVRFLILTPTRELAMQVFDSIHLFTQYTLFKSAVIFGGVNSQSQQEHLSKGVDILVATPGRLLDLIEQGLHLNHVSALVLDEADRMLDMGFLPAVSRILQVLPQNRQSLLFSATFSKEIKKLATRLLNQPEIIEIAPQEQVNKNIEHVLYNVESEHKKVLLIHLLSQEVLGQTLIFVKTKQNAASLTRQLNQQGIAAECIHGDRSQNERLAVFQAFKENQVRVLVATDIAARGLDVDDLPFVMNFDLPTNPEDYVHRIGRTGRAGKKGVALSLFSKEETPFLKDIETLIQQKITIKTLPAFPQILSTSRKMLTKCVQNVASDGFRFDLPYTPKENTAPKQDAHSKKRHTILAVLLGGSGK